MTTTCSIRASARSSTSADARPFSMSAAATKSGKPRIRFMMRLPGAEASGTDGEIFVSEREHGGGGRERQSKEARGRGPPQTSRDSVPAPRPPGGGKWGEG